METEKRRLEEATQQAKTDNDNKQTPVSNQQTVIDNTKKAATTTGTKNHYSNSGRNYH